MRALALTAFLVLPVGRAAAQEEAAIPVDHETWRVLGWNDACGVAFEHLYYPKLGKEAAGDPIETHVGAAEIPPGGERYVARWAFQAEGRQSWDQRQYEQTEKDLRAGGYTRPGFLEVIQDAPIGAQPGLAQTILSTSTLSPRLPAKDWPGPEWRWAGGNYSPLGTCALLSFEKRGAPRQYRLLLLRVYNPRARRDRAYAHASNARLLFNAGNLSVAAPEAETAARLDPELPMGRYEHAAMLALTGNIDEAVRELSVAVKLDPNLAAKAKSDVDFVDLKDRQDFQELTSFTR